jgi:flagellar biosynthesis/type III secretory pathway chaperone
MSDLESIKSILADEVVVYRTLLDILQREREYLVHLNAAGVEALSKEKDTVVLKLRLLEEERVRLMAGLAAAGVVPAGASLQELSGRTGDEDFHALRLRMLSLLQSISELNEFNRILIERSSGVVKNALNFLGAFGMNVSPKAAGTVLSREA